MIRTAPLPEHSRSLRRWCARKGFSHRSGLRWVRRPLAPLPAVRIENGRYYINYEAAEAWLRRQHERQTIDLDRLVDEVVAAVKGERS